MSDTLSDKVVLPIVREHEVNGLFGKQKMVVGVWNHRIVAFQTKANAALPHLTAHPDSAATLASIRRGSAHALDVDPAEVASATAEMSLSKVRFTVAPPSGRPFSFSVATAEAANLAHALEHVLGDRFSPHPRVSTAIQSDQVKRAKRIETNRRLAAANQPPFRSPALGWTMKGLGALAIAIGVYALYRAFAAHGSASGSADLDDFLAIFSVLLIGNFLYRGGRRIAAPDFETMLAKDRRAPILFLRSFDSEDVESPQPGQAMSERVAERLIGRIPGAPFVVDFFIFALHYFYSLRGTFAERVEEQIGLAVKRHGPMIAIGKPGERIATPGAARAYVRDDEWQAFILKAIDDASLVLIQVENTEGTWWEFNQCIQRVPPQKLLVMLTAHYGSPSAYERLRLLSRDVLPKPLPVYAGKAAFLHFDEDWNATLLPLHFRAPFLRSLLPSAVNYKRSIAPFLQRAAT